MAQSQTVKLARGQLLCFARPEQDSGNHIHFLKFKAARSGLQNGANSDSQLFPALSCRPSW